MKLLLIALLAGLAALADKAPKTPASRLEQIGEYKFRWERSKTNPKLKLPLLAAYPDAAVLAAVNEDLAKKLQGLGCEDGQGEWETKASVGYAGRDVLSVVILSSFDCGGAHPDQSDDSTTYDLKTGRAVQFERLFEDYDKRSEAILRAIFAARIDESAAAAGGDQCPDKWPFSEISGWTLQYHLEPGGLVVSPLFPHALAACSFETKLALEKLQTLGPAALLRRLSK